MTWFEIYAVLAPLQLIVVALIAMGFAHWQDARWNRRESERKAGAARSPAE